MPGLEGIVSSIRPGREQNAGPDHAAVLLRRSPLPVFRSPNGVLHKHNRSSIVLNLSPVGKGIDTDSASKPQPTQCYDQGYSLGSVLLASFSERPAKPADVPKQRGSTIDIVAGRSDMANSCQPLNKPQIVRDCGPAHITATSKDLGDKEAVPSRLADLVDTGLISFAEIQRGKGFYMTADGSMIDQHGLDDSQDWRDTASLDNALLLIAEQRNPQTLSSSTHNAVGQCEADISRPGSSSTFYSLSSLSEDATISRQVRAGLDIEGMAQFDTSEESEHSHRLLQPISIPPRSTELYFKGRLPAIRDLNWSTLNPADFEQIANAYNDISPMDSAVFLPEQAKVPSPTYHGKGKGRATDERWHEGSAIVFAPHAQLQSPNVAYDHPSVAQDHLLVLERQSAEARRAQEAEERAHAEAVQAEIVEQEEACMRFEQETAKFLEQQLLEEDARLAAKAARLHECNVCGDSKPRLEFPIRAPSASCTHEATTCVECLVMWMASELETKGSDSLKCPECPSVLQYNDVQRAASSATFEAYENLLTRNALAALDDFAWCLNAGCGSGQENPQNNNYMDCAACGYRQCLSHKCAWHSNETCAQYDDHTSGQAARDAEAKTEAMLDGLSKKCPGPACGWRIEKVSGCDHMRCKRCKYEFCWQCLASHAKIKKEGNTAHEKWCKFHSDKLDVAWPFNAH